MSGDYSSYPSLTEVLGAFLGGGPIVYAEVETEVLAMGCVSVDDLASVEAFVPKSRVPIDDIAAWSTGFSNAPFLILTRAATPHPSDASRQIIFRTRRVWITEVEEQGLYEWVTEFCGHDAAGKKDEAGGHHSWLWAWPSEDERVLQDGMRLYVAGDDDMMILERISAATA